MVYVLGSLELWGTLYISLNGAMVLVLSQKCDISFCTRLQSLVRILLLTYTFTASHLVEPSAIEYFVGEWRLEGDSLSSPIDYSGTRMQDFEDAGTSYIISAVPSIGTTGRYVLRPGFPRQIQQRATGLPIPTPTREYDIVPQ